jgi:hypothetical protein
MASLREELAAMREARETGAFRQTPGRAASPDPRLAQAVEVARGILCSGGFDSGLEEIAAAGGASLAQLRSPSRRAALVDLRRVAAQYLRSRGCSLPEIGAALHRDHTTIRHLLATSPAPVPVEGVA